MKKLSYVICRLTPYWLLKRSLFLGGFTFFFILTTLSIQAEKAWYPVEVDVWAPPFNDQRQREQKLYTPLERAQKKWRIRVSFPT
jgi:protein TorT